MFNMQRTKLVAILCFAFLTSNAAGEEIGIEGLGIIPRPQYPDFYEPKAISADGTTVVGDADYRPPNVAQSRQAFYWTRATGAVNMGFIAPSVRNYSVARAVSSDGSYIAGVSTGGMDGGEMFRWTINGGMIGYGDLPGGLLDGQAKGI